MKKKMLLGMLLVLLVASCAPTPTTTPAATTTNTTLPTLAPTPTVDFSTPEQVGRAYLTAWEAEDYAQMYALLSPALRSGLALDAFQQAHTNALQTTSTLSLTLTPHTLGVEGATAWIDFDEQWHTALFGELQTANRLNLSNEGNLWWINWQRETLWPELAGGNAFAVEYQIPPRANIYDRAGTTLAGPSTVVTIGVIPEQIQDETAVLNALSLVLNLPGEDVRAAYAGQPPNWYIPIGDITGEVSLDYDALLSQPGIERRERAGRLYYANGVGAHVIGWVSPIPAEALDEYRRLGYRGDEWVGITGLEAWGEEILAGRNGGQLYLIGPDGTYVRKLAERRPERGRALYTTLDRDLQQQAELTLGDRRGAIVALDVHTGAILALTSGPGFDNNIFIRPTDEWQRSTVLNDPNRPLFNRALQGLYPCGSVFKIVTITAGLEAGGLTAQSSFYCPGYWDGLGVANRKSCWLESGHGAITLQDGLTASCNVTFYEVGSILDARDPTLLPTYARAFGLGQLTGLLELPEQAGTIPDPDWKFETYREYWGLGDTVNLAIGQGYLQVTPLQIVHMMAAVANGGTLYRPYLIQSIAEGNGYPEQITAPQVQGQLPISPANLATLQQALWNVTTQPYGTATHRFVGLGIPVAGKTGTAEAAGYEAEPHSWFAGYFPADDPQIAIVVMVENAGEGSTVAAPMFRQLVEAYYHLAITPLPTPTPVPEGD